MGMTIELPERGFRRESASHHTKTDHSGSIIFKSGDCVDQGRC